MSSVIKIYKAFNDRCWGTGSFSWDRDHAAGVSLWNLLIRWGVKFAIDDLVKIQKLCDDAGRHRPQWYGPTEDHYSLAVRWGNLSFAYAYEKLVGRKPFVGTGLLYPEYPYVRVGTSTKQQGRVVEGCEFMWEGETVKVTTFRDDENYLIACAYHPQEGDRKGYQPAKIKRRFKITHDMWAAANRLQKKADKLEADRLFIHHKEDFGYYIEQRGNLGSQWHDSTGLVEPGKKLGKYKPFKTLAKAYEAAVLLVSEV